MLITCAVFAFALVAACSGAPPAHVPAAPAPTSSARPPQVWCGDPPTNIFTCIGGIDVFAKEVKKEKCRKGLSECDRVKCLFRESGWALPGDKVNKQKLLEYFTQYAVEHPEWSAAVQNLKQTCLGAKDVPPQGATLDCAPYDILHCIMTSFIKNISPGLWRPSAECVYPRSYAQACPYCPSSCFALQVPNGSCNACRALPTAP